MRERRPALVVIDTVAMAFPGLIENDADAMGRVVAVARALTEHGAAVLLVLARWVQRRAEQKMVVQGG